MKCTVRCWILSVFLLLNSCRLLQKEDPALKFSPAFQRAYRYSVAITSATSYNLLPGSPPYIQADQTIYDTVELDFTLKNIYYTDTLVVCKLLFDGFRRQKPASAMVFYTTPTRRRNSWESLYTFYDSIGLYLQGLSVQAVISKKGVVRQVAGVGDMLEDLARASNRSEQQVRLWMRDYIGGMALTDLLNRIFSIIPKAPVKQDDRWVRNITLESKAPIKISNLNTFKQRRGDTVYVNIESIVSAEQSEGGTVYMRGKQRGHAVVNYSSGMPALYETTSETVTSTSHQYEVVRKEHFLLRKVRSASR